MKLGIIGTGNVGGTLGKAWASQGHQVMFGVRDPHNPKVQALLEAIGARASTGTVAKAAASAEVVILAVPWTAAQEAIRSAGDLSAKILVDCTNPLLPGTSSLAVGHTTSAAEQIAGWAEGASVVKTFNSTGSVNMVDPRYGSQPASMFLCGDDSKAKSVVARLGEEIGFEMIDAGPLANARLLEPLAMLWISLAYRQGLGPNIAFKLLRR